MSENRRRGGPAPSSGRPPSNDALDELSAAVTQTRPATGRRLPPRPAAYRASPYRQGSNVAAAVCLVCGFGEVLSVVLFLVTDICAFGLAVLAFPIVGGFAGLLGIQEARRTKVGKTAAAVGMFLCMLPLLVCIVINRAAWIMRHLSP